MSKCKNCHCNCHCDGDLHADVYGVCTCDNCECNKSKRMYKKHKEWGTDMSYENNGGIVVDDTGECESCQ